MVAYCITVRLRATLCVVLPAAAVSAATTFTWAVVVWLMLGPLPEPQPDRPAANAQAPSSSRQSFAIPGARGPRLRTNTAAPVSHPGHQKASASRAVLAGVPRLDDCAVALMVKPTVTFWSFPTSVTLS